jgi:dienelactone hydrolase
MAHIAPIVIMVMASTLFAFAAPAHGAVHTESVAYVSGGVTLMGFLAYDDSLAGPRPGVLVAPEWWGLNDYAKMRAKKLAELGYVALAIDMYGDGKTASDADEAGKLSGALRTQPAALRDRANAGLKALTSNPRVDPAHVAAIGYCFGGTVVLELVYSGAPLAGAVTFHAGLTTPKPDDVPNTRTKLLICHGADDTFETPEQIAAFQDAMRKGGFDWQMIYFGGAVHSFTNPDSNKYGMQGVGYNANADRRSWEYMKLFFAEVLG